MIPRNSVNIDLQPILREALSQGFRAFIVTPIKDWERPADFVYLCLDMEGSFALIQRPNTRVEPPTLSVPIQPNRDYGSTVLVDYDGSVDDAVDQLRAACGRESVTVRFMRNETPQVPNRGKRTLQGWNSGVTEITADMFTD